MPRDKPSQSIPVKRVSVEAAGPAGDEEKLGPSHPSLSSNSHWGSRMEPKEMERTRVAPGTAGHWGAPGHSLHPSIGLKGWGSLEPWARNCPLSEEELQRWGRVGGASMRLAILALETPWWSLLGQEGCGGSPCRRSCLPPPVPQPASVGGEFLPFSFLAPIGRCHLGSVGRQARRWPWGSRW